MKTETLPLYRDGRRLMVFDPAPAIGKCKGRTTTGRRAWKHHVWSQADRWRYRDVDDSTDSPVVDAWKRLNEFDPDDASSLADVLFILMQSPAVESTWLVESGSDVRPLLCDRERTRKLLVGCTHLWESALGYLRDDERIPEALYRRLLGRRPTTEYCPDLFAFVRFGYQQDILSLSWAEPQVRSYLPVFHGGRVRTIRRLEKTVFRFCQDDEKFSEAVHRFLRDYDRRYSADWLDVASHFKSAAHRIVILDAVRQSRGAAVSPAKIPLEVIHVLRDRLAADGYRRGEIQPCLVDHPTGLSRSILLDLYRLSKALNSDTIGYVDFKNAKHRPDTEVFIAIAKSFPDSGYLVFRAWKSALRRGSVTGVFRKAPWKKLCPPGVKTWIQIVNDFDYVAKSDLQLRFLCDRLEAAVEETQPEIRMHFMEYVRDIAEHWSQLPCRAHFLSTVAFARTAAAGFSTRLEHLGEIFHSVVSTGVTDAIWSLGNLPRSAIKQIERKGRSDSSRERIGYGFQSLLEFVPDTDIGLLFLQPSRFLKALENLGSLRECDRRTVLGYVEDHPAFGFDPRRIGLDDAMVLCDALPVDPMPPALRGHASGDSILRVDRLAHYRTDFAHRTAALRIRLVENEIEANRVGRGDRFDPHTFRFLDELGKRNRRGLRKFLHAAATGDVSDYRVRHPLNRTWMASHPDFSIEQWITGLNYSFGLAGAESDFRIAFEFDPEEELKMGTYVDSCLGSGECNAFSAVANTLDINKRIAYLRDANGKVVARQLLAVSEQEKLIPFPVYHAQHGFGRQEIEDRFLEYDISLSAALGSSLIGPEEPYEIRPLVARAWYDDGAWEKPGQAEAHRTRANCSAITSG